MNDPITRLNAALSGRYAIERELGEGGMATVYLADDLKHERKVALKVLKPELAAVVGAERFLDEIKTTANLQHPHILPLFDSGEADGFLFYVMPYVEGESLRQKLDRERQLPVDEAVRISTNVAEALDYAHRQGVIHRDIKPANILLQDGKPVVSDFGIALAVGVSGGARVTETGLSLGTPQYMSPEQATGDQSLGPATDIWAVGCVLYEMLVGDPPYTGITPQAILGRILVGEPEPLSEGRGATPANVRAVVAKALEKLPPDRFSSAGHFASALADSHFRHGESRGSRRRLTGATVAIGGALAILLAVAGVVGLGWWSNIGQAGTTGESRTVRFKIDGNYDGSLGRVVAISPEGTHIAHRGESGELSVRSLDQSDVSVELQANGSAPFFSPDGEWIGFLRGVTANLMRISITGGNASPVAAVDARLLGASWGTDEHIVFATTLGLHRVRADGGEPELLAAPDPRDGELYYAWPEILPGAQAVLFTIIADGSASDAEAAIAVLDLDTGEQTVLLRGGSSPRYVETGHLIFSAGARLHAVAFDANAVAVRGEPVALSIEGIALARGTGGDFDVSRNGTLVYRPTPAAVGSARTLVWVDRDGREEAVSAPPRRYTYPRVSPDGTRVVVDIGGPNRDLYIWDFRRETLSRLTDDPGEDFFGHWSLDGRRVFFTSQRTGALNIFSRAADGAGQADHFFESATTQMLMGFSPDGDRRMLVAQRREGAGDLDIVSLTVQDPVQSETLLSTTYAEGDAAVSSDGNWIAYKSDVSGQDEVYVGPFPDVARNRWRVSVDGGRGPLWSPNSDELFYRSLEGDMMVARVELTPNFEVTEVGLLFPHLGGAFSNRGSRRYDISPVDGRFLMTKSVGQVEDNGIIVILNWTQDIADRMGN